jgi:dTDP-4-dehydrorhamnose 3,5-epimerase
LLKKTKIQDVLTYEPEIYYDHRGDMFELWNQKISNLTFVADRTSRSYRHVLRGLHSDSVTWKYISCIHGSIQLAVVDGRKESSTYGQWEDFLLFANRPMAVLMPPRVFNGHLCLSHECMLTYKWSEFYAGPEAQTTLLWNDPDLKINWFVRENVILSQRDREGKLFKEINL